MNSREKPLHYSPSRVLLCLCRSSQLQERDRETPAPRHKQRRGMWWGGRVPAAPGGGDARRRLARTQSAPPRLHGPQAADGPVLEEQAAPQRPLHLQNAKGAGSWAGLCWRAPAPAASGHNCPPLMPPMEKPRRVEIRGGNAGSSLLALAEPGPPNPTDITASPSILPTAYTALHPLLWLFLFSCFEPAC